MVGLEGGAMGVETRRLERAAESLNRAGVAPEPGTIGLVLGSGLKAFGDRVEDAVEVPFADVAEWPSPRVAGHGGALRIGRLGSGVRVACLTGRVHAYEGHDAATVVRPVRTLRMLGVDTFLLTNAAGGVDPSFAAGDLMVLSDHLNLTGLTPLLGDHEPALGERFPDMTAIYDPQLRDLLHRLDGALRSGVYAGNLGPAYETPAEVRMAARLGAHAVGMSTVLESMALHAMATRVVGLSLISNAGAGLSDQKLSHDEVVAAGDAAQPRLVNLVERFCAAVHGDPAGAAGLA